MDIAFLLSLVVLSCLARPSQLALLLGLILPIEFVTGLSPAVLDLGRYALTGALIVRTSAVGRRHWALQVSAIMLAAIGILTAISGGLSRLPGLAVEGLVMATSALLALALVGRNFPHPWLLRGLCFGVTLSALDILLQWAGLPYLGVPSVWGLDYSGFSEKRTHAAPLLAIGALGFLVKHIWPARLGLVRAVGFAVCLTGLVLTAGRAGFLGFSLASLLWAIRTFRRAPLIVALSAVTGLALVLFQRDSHLLDRLEAPTDLSSGRSTRNEAALEAFLSAPIFGPDPRSEIATAGGNAHTPVLAFAVDAGFLGVVGALIASVVLLFGVIRGATRWESQMQFPTLMAVVMTSLIPFEPSAFFVGLGKTVPLMVSLSYLYPIARSTAHHTAKKVTTTSH